MCILSAVGGTLIHHESRISQLGQVGIWQQWECFLKGHYGRKGLISPLQENIQLGEQSVCLALISLSDTFRATQAGFYPGASGGRAKAGFRMQHVLVSLIIHIKHLLLEYLN